MIRAPGGSRALRFRNSTTFNPLRIKSMYFGLIDTMNPDMSRLTTSVPHDGSRRKSRFAARAHSRGANVDDRR
jgi:hypothetical protein